VPIAVPPKAVGALLTGLASMAVSAVLAELTEQARHSGLVHAALTPVAGVEAVRRIETGEELDVVVLASGAIDHLVEEGYLVASSRRALADSLMAVAVPSGTPHPSMDTEEELREVLIGARAIGYSTGPSGDALLALLRRWAVLGQVADRLVQAPPGMPVARLIAEGQADVGFQQLSELSGVDGVDVIGPMPPGCEVVTTFVGAATASAAALPTRAAKAVALLEFFAAPSTVEAKRRHGLRAPVALPEPAEPRR
jgi:molybdate transport system substrate-binding protein